MAPVGALFAARIARIPPRPGWRAPSPRRGRGTGRGGPNYGKASSSAACVAFPLSPTSLPPGGCRKSLVHCCSICDWKPPPAKGGGGGNKVRPNGRTAAGASRALRGSGPRSGMEGKAAAGGLARPSAALPTPTLPLAGEGASLSGRRGLCDTLARGEGLLRHPPCREGQGGGYCEGSEDGPASQRRCERLHGNELSSLQVALFRRQHDKTVGAGQ